MTANGGGSAASELEAPHRRRTAASRRARVADWALLSFWRSASWLLGHLPARPSIAVAGAVMVLAYYALPEKRRWMRSNMAHVLGVPFEDRAAGRATREAYRNYGRYIVELMRLPWLPRERCEQMLEVEGLEEVRRVIDASNGVVMAGPHLANNEAAASGFASNGLPITVVGDDSAYGGLYELLEQQRNSWGLKMVGWRNLRGCFRVLQQREVLALLIDWGYRREDVPVRLCGRWTTLPAGPAFLASRYDSTILPFHVERLPGGRFRGIPDEPIRVASTSEADIQRATQALADALGRALRHAPNEWYIFKPVWPETEEEERALEARAAEMLAKTTGRSADRANRPDRRDRSRRRDSAEAAADGSGGAGKPA